MGTWNKEDGENYTGMTPEGAAILKKQGKDKKENPSKTKQESPEFNLSDRLLSKKMKELQEFGKKYGAKDTSKKELVAEILNKAPDDDIQKFVEVK